MTRIGDPISRPEGPAKVTGAARYSADHNAPGQLHAVYVGAPIARGRVTAIDIDAARALPGVARILVAADMPRFGKADSPPAAVTRWPMQDNEIWHEGQPVAIVLGETLEAAEAGARAVRVTVAREAPAVPGRGDAGASGGATQAAHGMAPSEHSNYAKMMPLEFTLGEPAASLAGAAARIEGDWLQPSRHNNPMEPSATLARWQGDQLTMWDSVQHGYSVQGVIAAALSIRAEDVRIINPHTGGGFGSKGYVWPHQLLAAASARIVGRPVKLVLARAQMYANVGYQPLMRQALSVGAAADGRLAAIRHSVVNVTATQDDFVEFATAASKSLYATPAMALSQRVERVNANMPTAMRAPVDGPGTWPLESAIDELAQRLGIDPLDLRLANVPDADPTTGKPWSSCRFREALTEGAARYGWRDRAQRPRTDGHWRIGHGMASCTMGTFRMPSAARVRLRDDGTAVVETGCHDIGSGTTTIMPQIVADTLGLPIERVTMRWGDTSLPQAGPTYGSSSTIGVGAAVLAAAEDVRARLGRIANIAPAEAIGTMRRAAVAEIVGEGRFALPGDKAFDADGGDTPHAMRTWGAIFVEVGVDPELGLLRLRRAVGSYSAGRILNAKTARSQMTGGIIWGWGKAAMEASVHEPVHARWLAKNLSNVHIPVNADIPSDITIHFVDEFDPHVSAIGGRGIGELGATGVAAAVANAVHDAIGKRFRTVPITPEMLLTA